MTANAFSACGPDRGGPEGDAALKWIWWGNLLSIFAVSVFGRVLQGWTEGLVPLSLVGFLVTGILVAAVVFWSLQNLRRPHPGRVLFAGMAVIGILVIMDFQLERPEEKMHMLLFGLFGFLTWRLFGIKRGIIVCLLIAGLDEGLQGLVPSRVPDWHDVGLNSLSAAIGLSLEVAGNPSEKGD